MLKDSRVQNAPKVGTLLVGHITRFKLKNLQNTSNSVFAFVFDQMWKNAPMPIVHLENNVQRRLVDMNVHVLTFLCTETIAQQVSRFLNGSNLFGLTIIPFNNNSANHRRLYNRCIFS